MQLSISPMPISRLLSSEFLFPRYLWKSAVPDSGSVVSRYCFGADDDILGDAAQASALRNNLSRLLRGVKFNYHFGWVRTVIARLPTSVGKHFVPAGVIDMMNFRKVISKKHA